MKKLSSFLYWTICFGSILIGGILLSVGVSLGGATSFSIGSNGLNFYHDTWFGKDATALHSTVVDEQVLSIDLDLEFTEVIVTSGDFLSINYTPDIAYKIKDDTLEITSTQSKSNRFGMYFSSTPYSFVKITVPDYVISLDIETSSKTEISNLTMDKIELDIALGDTLIENTTSNSLDVEANLGHIELNHCSFDTLKADLDMGNLTTSNLEVVTSAKLKNDMGSLNIDLSGEESDYNFISSVDMGSLSINGKETSSFSGLIDIFTETTMGSAKITTN